MNGCGSGEAAGIPLAAARGKRFAAPTGPMSLGGKRILRRA
jgi:hypothetical protein